LIKDENDEEVGYAVLPAHRSPKDEDFEVLNATRPVARPNPKTIGQDLPGHGRPWWAWLAVLPAYLLFVVADEIFMRNRRKQD